MNDLMRQMFTNIDGNVKVHVTPTWFWHLKRSKPTRTMKAVGWEYDRWDGTGNYYTFADAQISDKSCNEINLFLN
jgi:hypothetical protein